VKVIRDYFFPDILRGGDGLAWVVLDGLTAEVDAGFVGRGSNGFGEGEEVSGLLVEEAAAFFLIEEEDCASGKLFALCSSNGGGGVLATEGFGSRATPLRFQDLRVEAPVE